ncbi:putative transcriptional regulatory protein [Phycisphaerae bacterium RAS1]|nr:putative transcriptional regulatory protein [Phycisphaerae bacterium RAS1]
MAGHSHWARIKRSKAVVDARRGKHWSKLARAVILAARNGPDPDANLALRYAIDAAKDANMPRDTIERAIKKGSGELGGQSIEELIYEGYGPAGAAVMCRILTDNRNRTSGEIKNIFENRGGNLGATNCVAWMFTKRGVFIIAKSQADEEKLTNFALEVGADDVKPAGDEAFELTCDPTVFAAVRKALDDAGIKPDSAEITMVSSTTVTLTGDQAATMMRLVDALEDHDDVQNVYSNFEIPDDEMQRLSG